MSNSTTQGDLEWYETEVPLIIDLSFAILTLIVIYPLIIYHYFRRNCVDLTASSSSPAQSKNSNKQQSKSSSPMEKRQQSIKKDNTRSNNIELTHKISNNYSNNDNLKINTEFHNSPSPPSGNNNDTGSMPPSPVTVTANSNNNNINNNNSSNNNENNNETVSPTERIVRSYTFDSKEHNHKNQKHIKNNNKKRNHPQSPKIAGLKRSNYYYFTNACNYIALCGYAATQTSIAISYYM